MWLNLIVGPLFDLIINLFIWGVIVYAKDCTQTYRRDRS